MSIFVDDEKCISCGLCEENLPRYFELVDGKVRIKKAEAESGDEDELEAARQDCPGEALGY
jgi:ferredoxin